MTSTIKVNNIQNQCGQNIINENSNTITIGASGDTIALASGASQTGFGREGSVNWQTGSIKTSTFTAASGEGYFINSSGSITANLPAGSAGAIVAFSDYARNFNTHNFVVSPNGSEKIGGIAGDLTLSVDGQALTLVYVDSTKGWINVQNAEDTEAAQSFITATGGTVTTVNCGACKVHTFTGPGTFCVSGISDVSANNEISYMIVGGGGGAGSANNPGGPGGGGGGGAGGFREVKSPVTPYTASPLDGQPSAPNRVTVTATAFPIVVGGGGAGGSVFNNGTVGVNSTAFSKTSAGGGFGGKSGPGGSPNTGSAAGDGGSGGGGGGGPNGGGALGAGNTPPVTPNQGFPGGGGAPGGYGGGQGGGATVAGYSAVSVPGGNPDAPTKGTGATTSINGTPTAFAGGGGGGGWCGGAGPTNAGGTGGGGQGSFGPFPAGGTTNTNGTDNTGGGGGGAMGDNAPGKNGGSGIVIIRYKIA